MPAGAVRAAAMATVTAVALTALAACSSAPAGPQVTPVNATIKLGRVTGKTFLCAWMCRRPAATAAMGLALAEWPEAEAEAAVWEWDFRWT